MVGKGWRNFQFLYIHHHCVVDIAAVLRVAVRALDSACTRVALASALRSTAW